MPTKINETTYVADDAQDWTRELVPPPGKKFYGIEIDGVAVTLDNEFFHTVTLPNVTAPHTIKVCLVDAPAVASFLVSFVEGTGGECVNFDAPVSVPSGASLLPRFVPFAGKEIYAILVNGVPETITNRQQHTVNLSNITQNTELIAIFRDA
jgi:hypothetical protein